MVVVGDKPIIVHIDNAEDILLSEHTCHTMSISQIATILIPRLW